MAFLVVGKNANRKIHRIAVALFLGTVHRLPRFTQASLFQAVASPLASRGDFKDILFSGPGSRVRNFFVKPPARNPQRLRHSPPESAGNGKSWYWSTLEPRTTPQMARLQKVICKSRARKNRGWLAKRMLIRKATGNKEGCQPARNLSAPQDEEKRATTRVQEVRRLERDVNTGAHCPDFP